MYIYVHIFVYCKHTYIQIFLSFSCKQVQQFYWLETTTTATTWSDLLLSNFAPHPLDPSSPPVSLDPSVNRNPNVTVSPYCKTPYSDPEADDYDGEHIANFASVQLTTPPAPEEEGPWWKDIGCKKGPAQVY